MNLRIDFLELNFNDLAAKTAVQQQHRLTPATATSTSHYPRLGGRDDFSSFCFVFFDKFFDKQSYSSNSELVAPKMQQTERYIQRSNEQRFSVIFKEAENAVFRMAAG